VASFIAEDGRSGSLVSLGCAREETLRMGGFVDYLQRLSQHVLEQRPTSLEELGEQDWSAAGGTVTQAQRTRAEELDDVLRVLRLARFESHEGWVFGYEHPSGQGGVLVALRTPSPRSAASRVALQLTGMLLNEPVGDCGVGEQGALLEWFDPLTLSCRALESTGAPEGQVPRTVQDMLEDRLGGGTRIESYACFRGGA
jgi:translation elongation factor EF-Ts